MNISYRNIKKSDYPFLREMLYQSIFTPPGLERFDKSIIDNPEIAKYIENWNEDVDFGILISIENLPIGAIWARLFTNQNKGYGYVNDHTPELGMALYDNYRNLGLGTRLMEKFLEQAKTLGYKSISLSVDKRSPAFRFYERFGFTVVDELETAYTMIKSIG
jgi:ribosomal protein S18 acetylase RimI-like enzyme